jgi:aryl-alcohol dehydrogenase-like predicted oxidoreductase
MVTRREWLGMTLGAGAALTLNPGLLGALPRQSLELITRTIPGTSEQLPLVGLGSSATFAQVARSEDVTALREVLTTMVEHGGTVFDTAPGYGASEEVAGRIAQESGIAERLFWATKLNVARPGERADAAAARAQLETSFRRIGKPRIDLVQIHNVGDIPTQLPILQEAREQGRVRYIGVTTTFEGQYEELLRAMRDEPIDFIGTDYAVDNRHAEERIFPLAQERGIGVLVYAPFGRTRLWSRVAGREVPAWAAEFDARSWAQFFLKFAGSHPAVTTVTPATSRAVNMVDNIGAALGRLPNEEQRRRMVEYVEALPAA